MSKSRNKRPSNRRERHISVRSVRRSQTDIQKLARVLLAIAETQAQAEADAKRNESGESS